MIKKLFNWLKGWDYRIKFLMVGGLNTVVGVGSYWLLLLAFGSSPSAVDVPLWIKFVATFLSQMIGMIHSYLWNKFFTFESNKKDVKETARFVGVYAVAFGVDYLMKWLLTGINQWIVAVITTITTMIISFVGQKIVVFKYKKPTKEKNKKEVEEKI